MVSELGNKKVMASNIKRHLDNQGLSVRSFALKLGFKYTTVLDWVNAKTYPRIDKIEKMANFFNVEKSDLIEEYSNTPTVTPNAEPIAVESLKNRFMTFDGKPLTDDDLKAIQTIIEVYLGKENSD